MGINLSGVRVFFRAFFCSEKEFISGPEPGGGGAEGRFLPQAGCNTREFLATALFPPGEGRKKNEVERL